MYSRKQFDKDVQKLRELIKACEELAEWGVDGCAKVDFDDADLDIAKLDRFIKAENGYIREVA